MQDLPDDPLPDTTHLNGPSAPPHVLSRQAQTYHSPGTTMPQQHAHYSQLLSPPSSSPNSHAHMHDAHAHAHSSFQGSTHMQRSNLHTGFVSQATSVADFRPEHSHSVTHQPAWMHGVHGMHIGWSEAPRAQHQQQPGRRGRVEGWSRPQSAQPGGFNREEPPASAEAVYLASQVLYNLQGLATYCSLAFYSVEMLRTSTCSASSCRIEHEPAHLIQLLITYSSASTSTSSEK